MNQKLAQRKPASISRSPFGSFFPRGLFSQGLFEDMFNQYLSDAGNDLGQMMNVQMDVAETNQAFEVKIDLPGIQPEDVEIHIDNNTLTIRGQRSMESEEQDEEKQYHRIERYSGSFARSVMLPTPINEDETAAEFKDGVLKIMIPKTEDAKPRKINISPGK